MPEVKTTPLISKNYIRISRTKFSSSVENYRESNRVVKIIQHENIKLSSSVENYSESKRVVKITQHVNHARGQNNSVNFKKLYTYFKN